MAAANVGPISHGKPSIMPGRRHSIAVGQSTPTFGASATRRKSIQDSIHHLTHNMSLGLRLALRTSRDCLQLNDETVFDKVLSRRMLSNHFKEKDLRVIKFVSCKKEDLEHGEQHDVEIWIKREDGHKKKLDIQVRVHREEEMETKVYNIIITKLREFVLSKKQRRSSFLCTPEHFLISDPSMPRFLEDLEKQDVESDDVNSGLENKIMVLENIPMKGYRLDMLGGDGLDYEHAVLAVSRLAKFHAVSYAFRLEREVDIVSTYPWLQHWTPASVPGETLVRLQNIFQQNSQFRQFSSLFIDGIKDCGTIKQSLSSNRFGVLGFGVLRRAQINFKYRSELESRLFCSDVIFQDLSQSCFVSCVIDLLQLLFTALDPEVREEYIADLVCSVYYDNFANAVTSLSPRVQMFSKNEFVREFERNILHGFIAGLNYHTQEYEDGLVIREEKENCTNSSYTYTQYRDSVLSMVRDILQFKINTKATIL